MRVWTYICICKERHLDGILFYLISLWILQSHKDINWVAVDYKLISIIIKKRKISKGADHNGLKVFAYPHQKVSKILKWMKSQYLKL